jgi:hypothetical protein
MADERIADAWVGQRVEAEVVRAWSNNTATSMSLTASEQVGVLEQVDGLGILASFEDGPRTFYPWAAVLSLRPEQ